MKKLFSVIALIAVLLSLAACGAKQPQAAAPAATIDPASPEAMYGHIDQTQPMDGIYKLWNAEGVKNIANHPDGSFELLCNVDMGGAEIAPIPEFTGTLNGANFTISNFTVKGEGADFGFISVNKGKVNNLYLDKVTFLPGGAANMGSFAGKNEGTILRCTITDSTMTVENAAEGAFCGGLVGVNTGDLTNTKAKVDVTYTASGAATVGGIAGKDAGGKLEFVDMEGFLTVTGSNKTTGILVGQAKDTTLNTCAFVGSDNSLDGKLFYNYYGTEENVTGERLLWRDNSRAPEKENIQVLREKAVQNMYDMCTIPWKLEKDLPHTCNCSLLVCNGVYSPTYTQIGIPYNHKNGSLARMRYCLNEDGTVKDWVYEMAEKGTFDTFDLYMGNDCSSCVQQAWLTVGNSFWFSRSTYQNPALAEHLGTGILPVGDYEWNLGLDVLNNAKYTKNYTQHNGKEVMYESYAQLRMGDGVCYLDESGHSRMVAEKPVVVRDESGKIDGIYSYILFHEQGVQVLDEVNMTYSMCKTFSKYTFENLFNGYYLPVTIEEFVTGEYETPTCTLEGGLEQDNRFALTTGTVKANYSLDYVTMVITDEKGNEVFNHTMFPSVDRRLEDNSNDTHIRLVFMDYDLAHFSAPLAKVMFEKGGRYHATITGNLATGDSFVVKDFSFTNG